MRQLGWAVGYNSLGPSPAGCSPRSALTLRQEIAALSMSSSSVLVVIDPLLLKLAKLG